MPELECEKWFEDVRAQIARGITGQVYVKERLSDLPFSVRPAWGIAASVDWCVFGDTLTGWKERVRKTAAALNLQPKVEAEHWLAEATAPPDLVARWKDQYAGRPVEVTVRALTPKGCMIDPRYETRSAVASKLHPECAAVIDELADEMHVRFPEKRKP